MNTEAMQRHEYIDTKAAAGYLAQKVNTLNCWRSRREVGRFADRCLLPRLARSDLLADNHQARRYADADPHTLFSQSGRLADLSDHRESGTDRPFGIVLMSPRVTEVDQHAITDVTGDVAVEARDCPCDTRLIGADYRTQVLGGPVKSTVG
jgi:hypothetical protein